MKENQEYKNEALAALKGRWAPSVLAVLAYMAVLAVFIAPYEIKAMQLSDDPTNLQLAADMMKWYPVFILVPAFGRTGKWFQVTFHGW